VGAYFISPAPISDLALVLAASAWALVIAELDAQSHPACRTATRDPF
jgi:hypothetical protein